MEKLMLTIHDEDSMKRFAKIVQSVVKRGSVIVLTGELGAGKTFFVQEVAKNLGIREEVKSPTFTIMHLYEKGEMMLVHFDLYRLESIEELEAIGFFAYAGHEDYLTAIEWGNKFLEALPPSYLQVDIKRGKQENARKITLSFVGERGKGEFFSLREHEEILAWEK